jgi:endonuclease YncB( thermonuclease family)
MPFDSETVMRAKSLIAWLVIIAVMAAIAHALQPPQHVPGEPVTGRARVIDGDSLEIAGVRIRLFGIDAPERDQNCRDGDGRTFDCGRKAARALVSAIAGREVTCTPVDFDRYRRNVAICVAGDSDLGEAMVRSGHAFDLARISRGRYAQAEAKARAERRGLWAGSFDSPATWRRAHPR